MSDLFFDQFYRSLVNGGGITKEIREMLQSGQLTRESVAEQRRHLIAALEQARIYVFDIDALNIVMHTAARFDLTEPLPDPRWSHDPMWIEFADNVRLGSENQPVRAIFRMGDFYELEMDHGQSKMIMYQDGHWHLIQGECTASCERPYTADSHMIPDAPSYGPQCECQYALAAWRAILAAFGMALRAEGIEQQMIERPSRERRRHPDKPTKADRNIPPQPYYVVLHLTQITDTSDSQQPRRLKPERLVTGPYDTRDSGAATIGRLTATVGILHPARVPCRQTGIPMGALRTNRELSIERYHIHCKMSSKQKGRSRSGGMALWLEPQRFPRHTLYEDESDTPDQHALRSDLPMHLATVEPFIRHLDPAKNAKWKEDRYVVVHGFTRRQYGLPVRTFVKK